MNCALENNTVPEREDTGVMPKVQKTVSVFDKDVGRQSWRGTLGLDVQSLNDKLASSA